MNRDEVLHILRSNATTLRERYFVRSLALFGSVVRNEARAKSDVDLLVEFDRPVGLLHFVGTAQYLEKVLGVRKVDLVLRRAVLPELREEIFAEAVNAL